jgi:hypothetical protein
MLGSRSVRNRLQRADLAEHDRIGGLEVRGVGDQRHMDADPVKSRSVLVPR